MLKNFQGFKFYFGITILLFYNSILISSSNQNIQTADRRAFKLRREPIRHYADTNRYEDNSYSDTEDHILVGQEDEKHIETQKRAHSFDDRPSMQSLAKQSLARQLLAKQEIEDRKKRIANFKQRIADLKQRITAPVQPKPLTPLLLPMSELEAQRRDLRPESQKIGYDYAKQHNFNPKEHN
jgi:hypothetical protein